MVLRVRCETQKVCATSKLPAHSKVLGETKQLYRKALAAKLRSSALGPGRHRPARGPEAALRGSYRACPDRGCLPASSTNYRGWQAASSGLQWPRLCGSLPAAAGAATRAAARTAAAAAAASSSSSSHGRQAAEAHEAVQTDAGQPTTRAVAAAAGGASGIRRYRGSLSELQPPAAPA
jgi:hypothetical protein